MSSHDAGDRPHFAAPDQGHAEVQPPATPWQGSAPPPGSAGWNPGGGNTGGGNPGGWNTGGGNPGGGNPGGGNPGGWNTGGWNTGGPAPAYGQSAPPGQPQVPTSLPGYPTQYPGYPSQNPGFPAQPPGHPPPVQPSGAYDSAIGQALTVGTKPGVIPLRPLTLGEILDGSFQVMRRQPVPVLASAALVLSVVYLFVGLFQYVLFSSVAMSDPTSDEMPFGISTVLLYLLVVVIAGVGQALLTGVLVLPTGKATTGHSTTFAAVWAEAAQRFLPLIGWPLLQALVWAVVLLATFGPVIGLGLGIDANFFFLLFVIVPLILIAGLWAFATFSFVPAALMLERAPLFTAIRRSFELTKSMFWRVLGILLVAGLISGVVNGVLQFPAQLIATVVGALTMDSTQAVPSLAQLAVSTVGNIIAGTVSVPFLSCLTTILYIDVRMRREGLDVELAKAAAS